jgi:hypothetical protein
LSVTREQAERHGVRVNLELGAELPTLRLDTRVMRQVLVNLLSNAIKFTTPGGEITLRGQMTVAGELLLQVCDSGIGMSEITARGTGAFVQARTTTPGATPARASDCRSASAWSNCTAAALPSSAAPGWALPSAFTFRPTAWADRRRLKGHFAWQGNWRLWPP